LAGVDLTATDRQVIAADAVALGATCAAQGRTPLHAAVYNEHKDAVAWLLRDGMPAPVCAFGLGRVANPRQQAATTRVLRTRSAARRCTSQRCGGTMPSHRFWCATAAAVSLHACVFAADKQPIQVDACPLLLFAQESSGLTPEQVALSAGHARLARWMRLRSSWPDAVTYVGRCVCRSVTGGTAGRTSPRRYGARCREPSP
jgi:hypothetical protein